MLPVESDPPEVLAKTRCESGEMTEDPEPTSIQFTRRDLLRQGAVAGLAASGLTALLAACINGNTSTSSPSEGPSSRSVSGTIDSPELPHALVDLPVARDLPGRIAYNTIEGDLWMVNGDGSGRRRLTDSGEGIDYSPTWAPTGSQIAFRTTRGDAADSIFIIDSDGENERQLSPPGVDAIFPAWSPDGRLIAYTAAELTVVKPDGRGERSLGIDGECSSWSPDGTTIAFCSNAINREGVDNWDVFVSAATGADGAVSTTTCLVTTPVPGSERRVDLILVRSRRRWRRLAGSRAGRSVRAADKRSRVAGAERVAPRRAARRVVERRRRQASVLVSHGRTWATPGESSPAVRGHGSDLVVAGEPLTTWGSLLRTFGHWTLEVEESC